MNLNRLVDMNATKFPEREALRYEGRSTTFSEIKKGAERVAGLLQSRGIEKGDKVAIMSRNNPSFVLTFYGALKAGGVAVPINHKLTAAEVTYILEHSGAKVLFFDSGLADVAKKIVLSVDKIAIEGAVERLPDLDGLLRQAHPFRPVPVDDDDPAELLYTSGTTGKPKGCVHTHKSVVAAGITGALVLKLDQRDRMLMAMPIWHSSPLNNWFMGTQYVGGTTVLVREYHPLTFLETIRDEKCTAYFGAPISYILPLRMIPTFDDFDLSSMRCWVYGGGPMAADTARMVMAKYKADTFYQVYGMTEAGPTGTTLMPYEQVSKAGSIGATALPGTELRLMKLDGGEARPGEVGEIWLRSDSMMQGYFKDEPATRAVFDEDWYRTGDMARIDDDSYLFIVDRMKDMIVTGGENVYSKEVEDAVAAHPGVMETAVVGIPNPEWGETVAAYIVLDKDAEVTEADLKAFLADRLAKYKIPRSYTFVESLPHTPSGKVMKYQLREESA